MYGSSCPLRSPAHSSLNPSDLTNSTALGRPAHCLGGSRCPNAWRYSRNAPVWKVAMAAWATSAPDNAAPLARANISINPCGRCERSAGSPTAFSNRSSSVAHWRTASLAALMSAGVRRSRICPAVYGTPISRMPRMACNSSRSSSRRATYMKPSFTTQAGASAPATPSNPSQRMT